MLDGPDLDRLIEELCDDSFARDYYSQMETGEKGKLLERTNKVFRRDHGNISNDTKISDKAKGWFGDYYTEHKKYEAL